MNIQKLFNSDDDFEDEFDDGFHETDLSEDEIENEEKFFVDNDDNIETDNDIDFYNPEEEEDDEEEDSECRELVFDED